MRDRRDVYNAWRVYYTGRLNYTFTNLLFQPTNFAHKWLYEQEIFKENDVSQPVC